MSNNSNLTAEQITLVKDSWAKVVPIAEIASELFYERLFFVNPELRPYFEGVNLPAQRSKLIKAINMVVVSLDRIETLVPMIGELGKRHVSYGVKDEHYQQVGEALLWTLKTGLKKHWNGEVKAAWTAAYQLLAEVMISAGSNQKLNAA